MKKLLLCLLFLACQQQPASRPKNAEFILGNAPVRDNRNLRLGLPQHELSEVWISRQQYFTSYNVTRRNPNWVAWEVSLNDLGQTSRTNKFEADPDLIQAGIRPVKKNDYVSTCLDRGHQTPSADRTSTRTDNEITFFMSNMLPQTAFLNRGSWERLEHDTREIVRREGVSMYVYAGPIYEEPVSYIGPEKDIAVPSKNFKIVADLHGRVRASVIMPNLTSSGKSAEDDHEQACDDQAGSIQAEAWEKYEASVLEIEKETSIDFNFLEK